MPLRMISLTANLIDTQRGVCFANGHAVSRDEGQSWQRVEAPRAPGGLRATLYALPPRFGGRRRNIATRGFLTVVVMSDDCGRTWREIGAVPYQSSCIRIRRAGSVRRC